MRQRNSGFTLIELMIVVAIIAIIASIAVPTIMSSRINSNESAAAATLKTIAAAQSQIRAAKVIDANGNGIGEYAYLAELAGTKNVRSDEAGGTGTVRVTPPVLSNAFGNISNSWHWRSGYVFAVLLPSAPNLWTWEAPDGGGAGRSISATHAEAYWAAYAWPVSWGNSGKRVFFINQLGELISSPNQVQRYSGKKKFIEGFSAVHHAVASPGNMSSTIATNATALDGEVWTVVN